MQPQVVDYLVVAVAYKLMQTTPKEQPIISSKIEEVFSGALSDRGVLESLFRAAAQGFIQVEPYPHVAGAVSVVEIPHGGILWLQAGYEKYLGVRRYLGGVDNPKAALEV